MLVYWDGETRFPLPTEPLRGERVALFNRTAARLTASCELPLVEHGA